MADSPLSASRVGSGGISFDVTANTDPAKAKLADLRNITSQAVKDLKLNPRIDFEETQFRRGLDAAVRKIQKESVKVKIAAELDELGLGDIARKIGAIRDSALSKRPETFDLAEPVKRQIAQQVSVAATRETVALQPLRASPRTPERDEMASELRRIRRDTARYNARAALFGEQGEEATPKPSAIMSFLRGGVIAAVAHEVAAAGFGVAGVAQGIGIAVVSKDVNNQRAGIASAVQGAESIPIIGSVVSGFDKLAGFTESLNNAMRMRIENEQRIVAIAQAQGDPRQIASAEATFGLTQLSRRAEKFAHPFANPTGVAVGYLTGEMQETMKEFESQNVLNALLQRSAERQRGGLIRSVETAGYAAQHRANLLPMEAARTVFTGGLANDLATAPTFMQGFIRARNAQELAAFDIQQARERQFAAYGTFTNIGASEIRVRNRGQTLADEEAFRTLRGAQLNIDQATNDFSGYQVGSKKYSFKEIARLQAISEARALFEGLQVQGGGVAGATNLRTTRIGDPYGIIPQVAARRRAMGMASAFARQLGGGNALDALPDSIEPWLNGIPGQSQMLRLPGAPSSDTGQTIIRILTGIYDALTGGGDY